MLTAVLIGPLYCSVESTCVTRNLCFLVQDKSHFNFLNGSGKLVCASPNTQFENLWHSESENFSRQGVCSNFCVNTQDCSRHCKNFLYFMHLALCLFCVCLSFTLRPHASCLLNYCYLCNFPQLPFAHSTSGATCNLRKINPYSVRKQAH